MTEVEYNALAAARKYVWTALSRARERRLGALNPTAFLLAEDGLALVERDLAKIDAVLDAEDRVGKAEAPGG